jgi:zinc D-Ala-D-Ala carboxypeptidase
VPLRRVETPERPAGRMARGVIAAALGVATIVAPLTFGPLGSPASASVATVLAQGVSPQPSAADESSDDGHAHDGHAHGGHAAGQDDATPSAAATPDAAAEQAAEADLTLRGGGERASRAAERTAAPAPPPPPPPLPGCSGAVQDLQAANGQLSDGDLCALWDSKHRLRGDAAVALARLNAAYRERFGADLCITDTYRSLEAQHSVRARKPGLAAVPGTSEHGWGRAVDLCGGVETGGGEAWDWLSAHAAEFGWSNPEWAQRGGSGPYEPWHWEHVSAQ